MTHRFGGEWTEIKLSILRDYLHFYTQALKNQPFKLVYIDAFAGTGERAQKIKSAAPLFREEEETEILAGSVRIALETNPPFHSYHFIEQNRNRFARLDEIVHESQYQNQQITLYKGEANIELLKIISQHIDYNKLVRAVLFLDPYGLSVEWSTLERISATQKIDVWFLFSLSGLYRNASINFDSMEDYKTQKLNAILGTTEWQNIFYSAEYTDKQGDLFAEAVNKSNRTASVKELENYVHQRLASLFHYVEKPVPLPKVGAQQFSLFLCVSNSRAVDLAKKVAKHIIQKHH